MASWASSSSAADDSGESPTSFRIGEDVVHAAFGEGVVTGVEPGGIVVVRFALDGSERKLMAEYAPITKR
jgi:DNA helicase-2/ATP-dependent DNA helicase PcrA